MDKNNILDKNTSVETKSNNDKSISRGLELKKMLIQWDKEYYGLGSPSVSDNMYDRTYVEYEEYEKLFPELKTPDSPTNRVGLTILSGLDTIKHSTPLLSIPIKSKNIDDLVKWYNDMGGDGTEVLVQLKKDGITINSSYENHILKHGATRGDGYTGSLVTEHIKTVKSTPLTIDYNGKLEARGEAIMDFFFFKNNFAKFNNEIEGNASSPRNLAAGSFNLLDIKEFAKRNIDIVYFELGECDKYFDNAVEQIKFLKKSGFKTTPYVLVDTLEELIQLCTSKFNAQIKTIDGFNVFTSNTNKKFPSILCDGLVLKVNNLSLRERLGFTAKGPRWAYAYKFESIAAKTTLKSVTHSVGKTGKITPTAFFDTVNLAGAEVSNATLNNYTFIKNIPLLDETTLEIIGYEHLSIGDTIIVEKSNDVIPRVVGILNKNNTDYITVPKECPTCGSTIELDKGGVLHYCSNTKCESRFERKLTHFVSRNAMNIDGLGESTLKIFIKEEFIKNFADIYEISRYKDEILSLRNFEITKYNKIINSIELSKKQPFEKVLASLSVQGVGTTTSKTLAKHFGNIDNLMNASLDELLKIKDVGEILSKEIVNYFSDPFNIEMIERLKGFGLNFATENNEVSDKFSGDTFVITGTLKESRNYYIDLIESYGGKVTSSVSKKTNYVLIGEDAGKKEEKARDLRAKGESIVLIESHDEFLKLLEL